MKNKIITGFIIAVVLAAVGFMAFGSKSGLFKGKFGINLKPRGGEEQKRGKGTQGEQEPSRIIPSKERSAPTPPPPPPPEPPPTPPPPPAASNLPDLTIENFKFSINDGVLLIANPVLKNIGDVSANKSSIGSQYHYKDVNGNQRSNWTVPGISMEGGDSVPPGGYFKLNGSGPNIHHCNMRNPDRTFAITHVYGFIDPNNYIAESNEDNNQLILEIPPNIIEILLKNDFSQCNSFVAPVGTYFPGPS